MFEYILSDLTYLLCGGTKSQNLPLLKPEIDNNKSVETPFVLQSVTNSLSNQSSSIHGGE